jgi:hypothetical protein
VHHPVVTDLLEVYLTLRPLPPACRPAYLVREDGCTYLAIDPRTTKRKAMEFVADHLTVPELNAYRTAYGGGPVGQYGLPDWMDDEPVDPVIPPRLRMPTPVGEALRIRI